MTRVLVVARDRTWLRFAGAVLARGGCEVVTLRDAGGRASRLAPRYDADVVVVERRGDRPAHGDVVVEADEKWDAPETLVRRVKDHAGQDRLPVRRSLRPT